MTLYRPPFDPYSERQEANDPNLALRSPWDGCWAWTLARAINGATGGAVTCVVPGKTVERVIRDAAGVPDRPGYADGGTLDQQIIALGKLAPRGTWYSSRPTQAEFRAHLTSGGIAVMAGWEDQAPASDAAYDSRFYYNHGSNGHSVFCQGVGDGKGAIWGNPEKFSGVPEPIVTIDAALKFVWDSQAGGYPRVEALLLNSVELALPIPVPPTPASPIPTPEAPMIGFAFTYPIGILAVESDPNIRGVDLATGALVPVMSGPTRVYAKLTLDRAIGPVTEDGKTAYATAEKVAILARNGAFTPAVATAAAPVQFHISGTVNPDGSVTLVK